MSKERFWVFGAEYDCMGFEKTRPGTQQMFGPFDERTQAQALWRQLSAEHSSKASARFSILSEQVRIPM